MSRQPHEAHQAQDYQEQEEVKVHYPIGSNEPYPTYTSMQKAAAAAIEMSCRDIEGQIVVRSIAPDDDAEAPVPYGLVYAPEEVIAAAYSEASRIIPF